MTHPRSPWRRWVRRGVDATIGIMLLAESRTRLRGALPWIRIRLAEERAVRRIRKSGFAPRKAHVVTIIATYRRADLLRDAVASALAQTARDQLVVVVDDAGGAVPDDLPVDERLAVIRLDRHLGAAGPVRNVAIRTTQSPYLAFLDDDNTWTPEHLEVSLAEHAGGADLTYTGLRFLDADGTEDGVLAEPFDRRRLRHTNYIDCNAVVVRRGRHTLFSRFPRGGFPGDDWELAWRLSRHLETRLVPLTTVRYLRNPESHFSRWEDGRGASRTA